MCLIVIVLCFSFVAILSDRSWKVLISVDLPIIVISSIIGYSLGILISRTLRRNNALKALEIQEKEYAWHDLVVKPDDLPEHREIVVVRIKFDMYHYAIATYSQIDGMWYLWEDGEFYQTDKTIIKWQKINE